MQTWELPDLANWRGKGVVSAEGVELGEAEEIVYEYVTQHPVFIGVGGGHHGAKTLLVPADLTQPDVGHLRVDVPKQRLDDQPPADIGAGFDDAIGQERLFDYFGLPFDPAIDYRVLGKKDYLPGTERNF